MNKILTCRIGQFDSDKLPKERRDMIASTIKRAILVAYYDIMDRYPDFVFSEWGDGLEDLEPIKKDKK